jgi:hypothetical protein
MSGFTSPNHTQTPNDLFEVHLPEMGYAELKVVLVVVRHTFGYHRRGVRLSVSEMEAATGLSRKSVQDGGATYWEAVVDDPPEEGSATMVEGTTTVLPSNTPVGVSNTPSRKERTQRKPRKKESASPEDASPHRQVMALWDAAMKSLNPKARVKDGGAAGKAIQAMLARGYTPEEIMACWWRMKREPFWEDKYLSMTMVNRDIDDRLVERNGNNGGRRENRRRGISPELGEQIRAAHRKARA